MLRSATAELRPPLAIHPCSGGGLLGRPLEWIYSGIPTQQPASDQHIADLLREHDLLLLPEDPPRSRTRSRRLIGYVTRDPEVMRLARALSHTRDAGSEHPLLIAARRIHLRRSASCQRPIDLTRGHRLEHSIQPGYL